MIARLEKIIFFLLIFLIPIQLGKHFWPEFSYVSGIRIDYLSPTLYITDLLLIFLFVLSLPNFNKIFSKVQPSILLLFFCFSIVLSTYFAPSPQASIFGIVRFFEYTFLGLYIVTRFVKEDIQKFIDIQALGGVIVSGIAILQFFLQHSLNGVFYFLGERTFSLSTIGIAKFSLIDRAVLRPYGTFPHPNVLAYFLLWILVWTIVRLTYEKDKSEKIFLIISSSIMSCALFLTFSRLTIILYLIFLLYILLVKMGKKKVGKEFGIVAIGLTSLMIYLLSFANRFTNIQAVVKDIHIKMDLNKIAFDIFAQNPIVGVGLNNFFHHELGYQKVISSTLLQPVHNIYLWLLSQIGLLGTIPLLILGVKTGKSVYEKMKNSHEIEVKETYLTAFILFIFTGVIGLFDHFPLTLHQGLLLTGILFGLCWVRFEKEK